MKFHVSNFDKPFITVHGHLWQLNPKVTSMEKDEHFHGPFLTQNEDENNSR